MSTSQILDLRLTADIPRGSIVESGKNLILIVNRASENFILHIELYSHASPLRPLP